jgi:hypothetical protein
VETIIKATGAIVGAAAAVFALTAGIAYGMFVGVPGREI